MPQVRADVTTQMGQLCARRTQMQQVCSPPDTDEASVSE